VRFSAEKEGGGSAGMFRGMFVYCPDLDGYRTPKMRHFADPIECRPAYALCVDHVSKSVVLAVRGTLDPADLLTDAVAYSLPFLDRKQRKVGYAHMGILR
jgi:hypothetical protein